MLSAFFVPALAALAAAGSWPALDYGGKLLVATFGSRTAQGLVHGVGHGG